MVGGPYEQLLATMRGRRSVRRFRPDPVPDEAVAALVEAARWAPSASNRQGYRLLLVASTACREALAAAVAEAAAALGAGLHDDARALGEHYTKNFTHFAAAPLVVVPIHRAGPGLLGAARGTPPDAAVAALAEADALQAVAAAVQNLLLVAHLLGLGACWMTGPLIAEDALARLLDVPRGWRISAVVPVGYAAETPAAPPRRPATRLVRWITEPQQEGSK